VATQDLYSDEHTRVYLDYELDLQNIWNKVQDREGRVQNKNQNMKKA